MRMIYPKSLAAQVSFVEQFLSGTTEPENAGLVSSSLMDAFSQTQTALDTAKATRAQRLTERIDLIAQRDAEMDTLKVLTGQTIAHLKHQIRKGILPQSVWSAFGLTPGKKYLPTKIKSRIRLAETLIAGDTYLAAQNLPRLTSPRVGELQNSLDSIQALEAQITATRNHLREAREALNLIKAEVRKLHLQGQRELDLVRLDKTQAQIRELKRNFGYQWSAKPTQEPEPNPNPETPTTDEGNNPSTPETQTGEQVSTS